MEDASVPVRRVPLVRAADPVADAQALSAVRSLLLELRPGVLHTHMAKAGTIGRLAAFSVAGRPRMVHTFHGHVLEGYFRPGVQRAFIEMERMLARHTDVLIAVSPEIREALLDLGIGRGRQFDVIPLGFDLSAFLAVEEPIGELRHHLGLSAETPLVGVVGRLVPIKDLGTMLRAIDCLPGIHLAVIGDGEMRPALQARARELAIDDRVHFTSWWPDVPGAMSDLDVVALTSRNEGTPVALIEAQAAGRPVVATDVGGVRFVVRDGVGGYLAGVGDVKVLADRIGRLLADPELRKKMGQAGREHVRHRFGKDTLLADIGDLYIELLRTRRRAR
jgi:glycosyltransferase involved in cell wall biosynthesis